MDRPHTLNTIPTGLYFQRIDRVLKKMYENLFLYKMAFSSKLFFLLCVCVSVFLFSFICCLIDKQNNSTIITAVLSLVAIVVRWK